MSEETSRDNNGRQGRESVQITRLYRQMVGDVSLPKRSATLSDGVLQQHKHGMSGNIVMIQERRTVCPMCGKDTQWTS